MARIAPFVAAVLLVAGCASRPEPIAVPASAKTIGIVSAVPSEIRVATTGMTVFENALDVVDVAEWHLDDVAAKAAAGLLSTRYQTVRATVDGTLTDPDVKLAKLFGGTERLADQVRRSVRTDAPVDLYLVISPSSTAGVNTALPNVNVGVGVSKIRNPFKTVPPVVHAYLQLTVLDVQSLKVIGAAPLRKPPGRSVRVGGDKDEPAERLDGFAWKDYWHELSEDQQDLVRDRIKALLASSITYTLRQMGLGS